MRVINFSDAKSQLNQVVDQVDDDADFTVIVRRYAPSAVVMSLDTFNSLMETLHLMKSSANIKHLEKSIAQYRNHTSNPRGECVRLKKAKLSKSLVDISTDETK